jgi:hypothetical protein
MDQLSIKRFNLKTINDRRLKSGYCPVIAVIGSRGTGKGILVKEIAYHMRDIPMMIAFSGTEELNDSYSKFVHPLFVYDKVTNKILSDIMKNQKKIIKQLKDEGKKDIKNYPEYHVCIILDDLQYDKSIMKFPAVRELIYNGRHFFITVVMCFQYMMGLEAEFRSNIDYIFAGKENKIDNQKRLYDYFFGGLFEKRTDFKTAFTKTAMDYRFMVLDNTDTSPHIQNKLFWAKADPSLIFKVNEKKWPIWNKVLKEKEESDDDEAEMIAGKKSKFTVKIVE